MPKLYEVSQDSGQPLRKLPSSRRNRRQLVLVAQQPDGACKGCFFENRNCSDLVAMYAPDCHDGEHGSIFVLAEVRRG